MNQGDSRGSSWGLSLASIQELKDTVHGHVPSPQGRQDHQRASPE